MKVGRKLDALVAELIMGWDTEKDFAWDGKSAGWWNDKTQCHFNPSTDIRAAMQVVNKLEKLSLFICLRRRQIPNRANGCKGEYEAQFWDNNGQQSYHAFAKTAEHAICLAALRAVGHTLSPESVTKASDLLNNSVGTREITVNFHANS